MTAPKSVTKVVYKKGKCEVTFTDNVEVAKYSLNGLIYAALKDVGKFICKKFREEYDKEFKKGRGKGRIAVEYWARKNSKGQNSENTDSSWPNLQVGIKGKRGFYAGFQETGTSREAQKSLLQNVVQDNISEIENIESKYLSSMNDMSDALGSIGNDSEEQGDSENE